LYLRLANLSRNVTPSVLTEILSHFGDLRSLDFVPHHPGTTKLKGVAYARFSTAEEARAALECLATGTKSSPEKRGKGVSIDQEEERKESEVKDTEEKQVSSEEEASEKESDEDSKKRRKEESKDQDKGSEKEEQVTWIDGRKIVVECLEEKLPEDMPQKKISRSRSRARPLRSSRDRRRRSPS
jgi:RNA recognition motif-containing protein